MNLRQPKVIFPIVAIGISLVMAALLVAARKDVETRAPEIRAPLVRVATVATEPVTLKVWTRGSVRPHAESDLVPEVGGRVTWVAPSLVVGGFFDENETLLKIDRTDYEVALTRARAAADARRSEQRVNGRNLKRSRELATQGLISARELEAAENAAELARASFREAEAALEQAERDLERTELKAPFAGRVRAEQVDLGQYVTRGTAIGKLYAVDYAEVRLGISAEDVGHLDLALDYRGDAPGSDGPKVLLHARFAGEEHTWEGRIVRTEGEIDPQTRVVRLVARVEDPYGRGSQAGRPPLAVGMFVLAEIFGHEVPEAVVLPRAALRGRDEVLIIDEDDRLRFRRVDVLRREGDQVIVQGGLTVGERVCLSQIEAVVDGMKVRTVAETS